MYPDVNSTK
jgi:hypothetical protein